MYSPVPWTPSCPSCPHGYYTIEDYPTFGGIHPQGTPEPNLGEISKFRERFRCGNRGKGEHGRQKQGVWSGMVNADGCALKSV